MLDHASTEAGRPTAVPFQVHLDVFEGPFDLLLGLLAKHQLDVTEVALSGDRRVHRPPARSWW